MRHMMILITALTLATPQLSCGGKAGRIAADVALPPSQEMQLGKEMSVEVEKELKILENPAITSWVKKMGINIVTAAQHDIPKGIQFTFKVVDDDDTVNAFAMPGGYIYIYTGLLKKAENEAEIAAVVGHEIAHVTQRHIAKRLTAAYGLSALTSVALGKNPGLLKELVAGVVTNGYMLKHSRDAERESDAYGMAYTVQAGYSPKGYVTFFQKLADAPQPPVILSSHPHPEERVASSRQALDKYSSKILNRDVGTTSYKQHMQALN